MVSQAAQSILAILAALTLVAVAALLVQAIAGSRRPEPSARASPRTAPLAVVIPAHDEAGALPATLESVTPQLHPGDRVIVVADNCADATAEVARRGGAEVVVRQDATRVGKGFALQAGVDALAGSTPNVVVFLDADCVLAADALDHLANSCQRWRAPIQASYELTAPQTEDSHERLSRFAWRIRTGLRPRGYARLGLPCHLLGAGMALPWEIVRSVRLASPHLAEDVLLGLDLALRGTPARFCPEAAVLSQLPPSARGREEQRTRWVHGHLQLVGSHVWPLLRRATTQRDLAALALAADLLAPPLSVLTGVAAALWAAALILFAFTGLWLALALSSLAMGGVTLFLALCWRACGRDLIGLRELARIPGKIASVATMVVAYAAGRRSAWNRSERS
ncbi:glycosyltransferase family 2 protein [Alsobacter sp. KACC 23698]|uniref:Glycosyltransferase family 2 protein n=1 Tax=Alsobacter sp. KACC 23698 TaxID=3149229 RepID=A0AAU7JIX5_9HYPH